MPISVVRNLGDLKKVVINGREVFRSNELNFHGHPTPVINTDNHFLYHTSRLGSSILCTCGGEGVAVGYHVYRKWHSKYIGSEVLVCHRYMRDGFHGDGST
jgi:hypothetical protein